MKADRKDAGRYLTGSSLGCLYAREAQECIFQPCLQDWAKLYCGLVEQRLWLVSEGFDGRNELDNPKLRWVSRVGPKKQTLLIYCR